MKNDFSIVISAPSGAGKTTIIREVMKELPDMEFSVSTTTRAPRPGETDGKDYYFVSEDEFRAIRDSEGFLEWALVHGTFYGTGKKEIDRIKSFGKIPLFDVDVQGSRSLRGKLGDAIHIFITPPSLSELEKRLRSRNTETEEQIQRRLKDAEEEIRQYSFFDYVIVNDDLPGAVLNFKSIIMAEMSRTHRMAGKVDHITEEGQC